MIVAQTRRMVKFIRRWRRIHEVDQCAYCMRCLSIRPYAEINHEARMHHNACRDECTDRRACNKRRKKWLCR